MRFVENGPDFPTELLQARQDGRLVVFAGSGVSTASAGLPDFAQLTRAVLDALQVAADADTRKVLEAYAAIEESSGVQGLFSPAEIFSLLEKEFPSHFIESEVAKCLKPTPCDPYAHRIVADLAGRSEGKLRLITTNFDRLFDEVVPDGPFRTPSDLYSLDIDEDWGLVHLHGRANNDYSGPERTGFVLSSGSFGEAYLVNGSAREFLRKVLENNAALFIGYSADDPPISYLMRGLNRAGHDGELYALQEGDPAIAASRWLDKGVRAIPYPAPNGCYDLLWDSLSEWVKLSRDPDKWYSETAKKFTRQPHQYSPWERGQFAHLASTLAGARAIATCNPPPPAEWLCVLDSHVRFLKPDKKSFAWGSDDKEQINFQDRYGLDSDPPPIYKEVEKNESYIPKGAWNGLLATPQEQIASAQSLDLHLGAHDPEGRGTLPSRLKWIATWISNVADDPGSLWWVARQRYLHPELRFWIEWRLQRSQSRDMLNEGWQWYFKSVDQASSARIDPNDLQKQISKDGWTALNLARYGECFAPRIKLTTSTAWSIPPTVDEFEHSSTLFNAELELHEHSLRKLNVPDAELAKVTRIHRYNLEQAVSLKIGLDGAIYSFASIDLPPAEKGESHIGRRMGLQGYILWMVDLFTRLATHDVKAAKAEFEAWPRNNPVFDRLIIWAAKFHQVVSGPRLSKELLALSDESFWDWRSQRDFMIILQQRWSQLSDSNKTQIERRILNGPAHRQDEPEATYKERSASYVLKRILWLHDQGCDLRIDIQDLRSRLIPCVPNWNDNWIAGAVEQSGGRGGTGYTTDDASSLLDLPLQQIAAKAIELERQKDTFLEEKRPFLGLIRERPMLALRALKHATTNVPETARLWGQLLNERQRDNIYPNLAAVIGAHLIELNDDLFNAVLPRCVSWLSNVGRDLYFCCNLQFEALWSRCIKCLQTAYLTGDNDEVDHYGRYIVHNEAEYLTRLLIALARYEKVEEKSIFSETWKDRAHQLLSLPGQGELQAREELCQCVNCLAHIDWSWTDSNLLNVFESNDSVPAARSWAGILERNRYLIAPVLYKLKANLFDQATKTGAEFRRHLSGLSAILLSGWLSRDDDDRRLIPDHELKSVLLDGSMSFRKTFLEILARTVYPNGRYANELGPFLRNVWPKQNELRSPELTPMLCHIAFSRDSDFSEIAEIVQELITPTSSQSLGLISIKTDDPAFLRNISTSLLGLLDILLIEDAKNWPISLGMLLNDLESADPEVAKNPIYGRLRNGLAKVGRG